MNLLHWLVLHFAFGGLLMLIIGSSIAVSLVVGLLCHWILKIRPTEDTNEELRQLFSVGAVLFSVIIGFLVVVTWQKYLDVEQNVVNEAAAVQTAYHASGMLSVDNAQHMQAGLRSYATAVVDDEWPKLAQRQESDQANKELAKLWMTVDSLKDADDGQITIGTSIAESLQSIGQARQSRTYESQVGLPWFFWAFVFAYAIFITTMFNLFKNRRLRVRLGLNAVLGLSIGSVFLFILLIDYPFAGDTAIKPYAFQQAIQEMR